MHNISVQMPPLVRYTLFVMVAIGTLIKTLTAMTISGTLLCLLSPVYSDGTVIDMVTEEPCAWCAKRIGKGETR